MNAPPSQNLLAIDVGSSRIKLGWFPDAAACISDKPASNLPIAAAMLPAPDELFQVQHKDRPPAVWLAEIERWLADLAPSEDAQCLVASVHAGAANTLAGCLQNHNWSHLKTLTAADLPLVVRVPEPHRVGIDRLLSAVAANRLRQSGSPAITVDMGTAITVDFIAADGAFEGGAILAGPALSLAALHAGTASLPLIDAATLATPGSPIGKSTTEAMSAGAYWGPIGAIRELIACIADRCERPPEVFVTGGGSHATLARALDSTARPVRHVPHLLLAGIQLAADCQ